jgi:glycosyltransferase A (GT-A) superfamily protein (DUF2064 family)
MVAKTKKDTAVIICIQEIREDGSSMNLGNQLSDEDILYLHQAFIADTIINALNLSKVDIKLFYSPLPITIKAVETIRTYLQGRLKGKKRNAFESDRFEMAELGPGRWGVKMDESFRRCFEQGYSKAIFIGSRTPTLTAEMIKGAIKILNKRDVVFGPTVEGRYYMIGFAHDYHIALEEFDWTASNIYSQVAAHIDERGLSWEETEIWYAVEHPEDMEYLARDINQFRLTGDEETARETEKVLERILSRLQ